MAAVLQRKSRPLTTLSLKGRREEGTLQEVLDALVGTMSCDTLTLAGSLMDVGYTTPFSATSSSNTHSTRGATPMCSPEGEGGCQPGAVRNSIMWTPSDRDLGMQRGLMR